jgi:hypothetical protein|tara:strand:+ start:486 stop:1487 length:1002 start_codon:yes stop_codon:yes gene_type:complete
MSNAAYSEMLNEKRTFFISLGVLFILTVLYILVGLSSWAEGPVESATNFCENISDGLIKEPVNAFSNFTYIIVGLVVMWNMPSSQEKAANPMLDGGLYPTLFAVGSIYIGIGSFAMHGTNTNWGTSMDWTGMLFFISFPVYYNLSRQFQWSDKLFMSVFFTMFILTAILDTYASNNNHVLIENFSGSNKLRLNHITRDYMWSLYIGTWIIQEAKNITQNRLVWMVALPLIACVTLSVGVPFMQILILCVMFVGIAMLLHFQPGQTLVRNPNPHLWFGVGFYVLGNIVWRFGRDGEAACNPDTLIQFHALWHLFTGLSVYFFYRYFTTENNSQS